MNKICKQSKEKVKGMLKIIPKKVVYSTARTMCKILGGTIPLPKEDYNFHESIGQYVTPNIIASCNYLWLPIIQVNNCEGFCLSALLAESDVYCNFVVILFPWENLELLLFTSYLLCGGELIYF